MAGVGGRAALSCLNKLFHLKQAASPVSWLLILKEKPFSEQDGCGSPCRVPIALDAGANSLPKAVLQRAGRYHS